MAEALFWTDACLEKLKAPQVDACMMPNHPGLVIDGTPQDTSHRFRGIGSYATSLISALRRSNAPSFRVLRLTGDDAEAVKIWRPSRNSYRLQKTCSLPGSIY